MSAKTNRARLSIIPEIDWGVTPVTPEMQILNWSNQDLDFAIESTTSNHKRADRMVSDVILTSAGAEGGYDNELHFEFSGPDDTLLAGFLWGTWGYVGGGDYALFDASTAEIVAATNTMTLTGTALVVGQIFLIKGLAQAEDNTFQTVISVDADDIVCTPGFTADESSPAGATIEGGMLRNGILRTSYTVERAHLDIDEYFPFTGMVPNEMNISIVSEELIECTFDFIGKDTDAQATEIGDTYLPAPITESMSSAFNVGDVMLDGVPIAECLLNGVTVNVNNQVEGKTAVGVFGFCDTSEDRQEVTGDLNLYFADSEMWSKFKDNVAFSLSFSLADTLGNTYYITLPRLKFTQDTISQDDPDFMDEAEYSSLADSNTNCQIQIDKFRGVVV